MAVKERQFSTVPLNWKEVYFTNCPMVSANNVDQELGWCQMDFKQIGVDYSYFRSRRETDFYPHYIHNLEKAELCYAPSSAAPRTHPVNFAGMVAANLLRGDMPIRWET